MEPVSAVFAPDLHGAWAEGSQAHLGICVPGFPSLFLMCGPNTNTSGGSILVYEETQAAYLRQALQHICSRHAAPIDVRADVEARTDGEVQAGFRGTAWTRGNSWYQDVSGRVVANWPGYMHQYEQRVRTLDPPTSRSSSRRTDRGLPRSGEISLTDQRVPAFAPRLLSQARID